MTKTYRAFLYPKDPLQWEFLKYAIYSTNLLAYSNQPQFVKMVYPNDNIFNNDVIQYYREIFGFLDEFEFYLSNEIKSFNFIEDYIEKQSKSEHNYIYLDNSIVPFEPFIIDTNKVYFFKTDVSENRYAKIYYEIGVYDKIYDDRIVFVPKSICKAVLNGIQHVRQTYNFNDYVLQKLTQFIIQTHTILNDISVELLDVPIVEQNDKLCSFLSNKTFSPSFVKV